MTLPASDACTLHLLFSLSGGQPVHEAPRGLQVNAMLPSHAQLDVTFCFSSYSILRQPLISQQTQSMAVAIKHSHVEEIDVKSPNDNRDMHEGILQGFCRTAAGKACLFTPFQNIAAAVAMTCCQHLVSVLPF